MFVIVNIQSKKSFAPSEYVETRMNKGLAGLCKTSNPHDAEISFPNYRNTQTQTRPQTTRFKRTRRWAADSIRITSFDRFLSIVGEANESAFRIFDLVLGKDPVLPVPDVGFPLHVRTDPDQIIRPFGSHEDDPGASARGQKSDRGRD